MIVLMLIGVLAFFFGFRLMSPDGGAENIFGYNIVVIGLCVFGAIAANTMKDQIPFIQFLIIVALVSIGLLTMYISDKTKKKR